MAYDLPNTIIDYFIANLQTYHNQGLTNADPEYLDEVVRGPLQDDPTRRAYFLTVSPDYPKEKTTGTPWRQPVEAMTRSGLGSGQDIPAYAVGGPMLYVNRFILEGWMPVQSTRELAYIKGGSALRHLERAFVQMMHGPFETSALQTTDGYEQVAGVYPQIFNQDGAHFWHTGGGATWFPRLCLKFHIYSQVNRNYWLGV